MSKIKLNQKGFSVIEVIIVIVVLALLGLVGWVVYKNHHKTASVATTDTTNSASTTSPYSGWKTYCDTIDNGCFKYPSSWSLTTSNINGLEYAQVFSPGRSSTAIYKSLPSVITSTSQSNASFYTASLNALSVSNSKLKVVGGYFTSSNVPFFYLVNASSLSTYPLKAGVSAQFEGIPDYSLKNSANFGSFYAYTTKKAYSGSADQAQSWYVTSDAKDCLLVVQSFYYQ